MLLSSLFSSVLVAPASLNAPGILFLPEGGEEEELLSGWTPSDYSGERERERESGLLLFFRHTKWHSPRGTRRDTAKYLQKHTLLKSTWPAIICTPAEADVKRSWHRAGLAQRGERGREEAER